MECTRKMTTRSEHGFRPKRPNKELPTPIFSPLQPLPKKVALNSSMKFCLEIIKELLAKKHMEYAWPFYEPVCPQQYPDYREVVKRPIDLTTIKTKIETGQYKTVRPFVKDMRLMITNCLRYNKPEAPVIEQARKVRDFFEYRFARIPEELLNEKMTQNHTNSHHNSSTNDHCNGKNKEKESVSELDSTNHLKMKLLETQVKLLSRTLTALTGIDTKHLKPKNGHKKSTANNKRKNNSSTKTTAKKRMNCSYEDEDEQVVPFPTEPFKFDDLNDLQHLKTDLENLDAKDLKNVLRILQSTEPSIKCDNDENIEIDFEALKPNTLIALRKYVSSCMLNNMPKKYKSLNGCDSSKSRSKWNGFGLDCDIGNGSSFASDSTLRLSDCSSDSESESSSDDD